VTVISCKRSRESPSLQIDKSGSGIITVQWVAESNDGTDGVKQILAGAQAIAAQGDNVPVPAHGAPYQWPEESDGSIFLLEISVQRRHDASRILWTIEGKYSARDPGDPPGEENPNPIERPVKYRLEHVTYSEVVDEDRAGNPIVNAAGQEFDEPLEDEKARPVLVVEKNYAALSQIIALNAAFSGRVNSDTFLGQPPRTWFCHTIPSSDLLTAPNGTTYYTATFRLEYNHRTWDRKILNRGFKHFLSAQDKTLVQATSVSVAEDGTKTKVFTNEPVLLADDGTRLPDGQLGKFVTVRVKPERAFSGSTGLGIDPPP
jgi:hypothetical protein